MDSWFFIWKKVIFDSADLTHVYTCIYKENNITQSLQKWGNGTAVRLPKKVVDAAHLKLNQPPIVSLKGKSIVLTPVNEPEEVTLESLLRGVTPSQVGGETDWGAGVGAERYE